MNLTIHADAWTPSGRGQIGLANGVVLYITQGGGPMSFDIIGENGRLFLLNDANESFVWRAEGEAKMAPIELPEEPDTWPAGPAMVRDLVQAIETGGRTACDIDHARRATEIGFAIHASSAQGGAKCNSARCRPVTSHRIVPMGK